MTKMTLNEKIAQLRTDFAIAKGGKHTKFMYYKIEDYYQVKGLMRELGLSHTIQSELLEGVYPYNVAGYKAEPLMANLPMLKFELSVTDGTESKEFSFITPFQSMKGMSTPAQEAGALQTYAVKYLFSLLVMADDGLSDPDRDESDKTPQGNDYSGATKTKRAKPEIKEPTPEDNQQEPPKNSGLELTKRYRKHFNKEIKKAIEQNKDIAGFLTEYVKETYKKTSKELSVEEMKEIITALAEQGYEVKA